eukprot:3906533-Rhodomonas_salina.1
MPASAIFPILGPNTRIVREGKKPAECIGSRARPTQGQPASSMSACRRSRHRGDGGQSGIKGAGRE